VTRIALIPSEPIRPHMAGAGIRYYEFARRLPGYGFEVVLFTPGEVADVPARELPGVRVRRFERPRLGELLADCDVAVSQGQLANDLVIEAPELPSVIDLHDPFLAENLHYAETLGLGPYLNDHATWVLQLSRGDFFLCASEEQRQFYFGFLMALGRIHPPRLTWDPDLTRLMAIVPFAVPDALPEPEPSPLLGQREAGEKRLLFGGLYDWYDPWPVLEAFAALDEPSWRLLFIRNPNPDQTPQKLLPEVERWCRERDLWDKRVRVIDWVPAERRYDLWREVDVLVATHRYSLETYLSLRIRFLDALVSGCLVVTNEGGTISRLLREYRAGWVVPPEDPAAVLDAFREIRAGGEPAQARRRAARELLKEFSWDRVLEPLVAFCRAPAVDPTKKALPVRLPVVASPDDFGFRVRGWLKRLLGSAGG